MLRAMGFSGPPHSPDSFFKITCALHFCSWMEKRFLQKSRNSGAFGLPASSDDWLDSFFKNFTPCSPHVPKCSRTNGMTLDVEPPGSLRWSYLASFLASLRDAAAPIFSAELGYISELQGCAREMSRSMFDPTSTSNITMSGLHSESMYLFRSSRRW